MTKTISNSESLNVESIIDSYKGKNGGLLGALEQAQQNDPKKYLSETTLREISKRLDIPLSRVYSVATFYSFFSLKPQGEHVIIVCRGTACHTRGSLVLLNEALSRLRIAEFNEKEENSVTSSDNLITIRTVACFGQCALAPVIMVDGVVLSRMTVSKLVSLLEKIRRGGGR
ncbi:MAG TPA: NAD(P)H-dependent oxidoreductase subunit E [Rectinema sp.]|jgi:NADH-quinone oxidoreductase subunit E|nr:NAD(P)H-dependent oxidoreductase subunit E [Spirochaetia bacterium]MDI9426952.1 NAD(P)H-dependent oxidoreductase subunit E [Spirochaetota bacterium]NLH89190.1 NAD(P)H-dependent oxidoreductase subunit E [Treponema sp.]OQC74397.1 MAG: NADP-reducing hydrogenase subunit HndA [Spirochaetes bacterium ADurb.Bin001]HNP92508.1 NAD(P)H-dependent oxidoreductase subunit E [Rectinema sp.]